MKTEEIWRGIQEVNGEYEVSSIGRVRSCESVKIRSNGRPHTRRSKILKPAIDANGYERVALSFEGKLITKKVHRLVAQTFIENPSGKITVNHIDCDKRNNNVWNLEWATHSENIRHAENNGLIDRLKGEEQILSVLKEESVLDIRRRYSEGGISMSALAKCYRVSKKLILNIIHKRAWKHI